MGNVLNKTTLDYRESVNTPDYPSTEWLHNPDMSGVTGVDKRYWKLDGDSVREMTTAEKNASVNDWKVQRHADLLASLFAYRDRWVSEEKLAAIRDEHIKAKQEGRLAAVTYLKPWVDFEERALCAYQERRDAIYAASTDAELFGVSLDFSNLDQYAPEPVSVSDAKQKGVL